MRYWLGVTDQQWFDFLSREQSDEVNFWQPSAKPPFRNLPSGAPFLFKLKKPFKHIAGGGYFVKFTTLPLSLAWEAFGRKNGASSLADLDAMIRRLSPNPDAWDLEIGCTVLTAPFFWPSEKWIEAPKRWGRQTVRGRYYDTESAEGARTWAQVEERLAADDRAADASARYGAEMLVRPRLGQGAFRVVVTDAYGRRCAITGERTLPVLEAAHIVPFAEDGPNELTNGMLLRSDFHRLFDLGFVTVTPQLQVEVSGRIREEWVNGRAYYRLHGRRLASVPERPGDLPDRRYLAWHNENRFQG